jgi:hypothetical protein
VAKLKEFLDGSKSLREKMAQLIAVDTQGNQAWLDFSG